MGMLKELPFDIHLFQGGAASTWLAGSEYAREVARSRRCSCSVLEVVRSKRQVAQAATHSASPHDSATMTCAGSILVLWVSICIRQRRAQHEHHIWKTAYQCVGRLKDTLMNEGLIEPSPFSARKSRTGSSRPGSAGPTMDSDGLLSGRCYRANGARGRSSML